MRTNLNYKNKIVDNVRKSQIKVRITLEMLYRICMVIMLMLNILFYFLFFAKNLMCNKNRDDLCNRKL